MTEYVYFEPAINMAHMSKGGRYRITKRRAEEILSKPGYRGKIVGEAPGPGAKDAAGPEDWPLELPPADYLSRNKARYDSGDASDTVKARYELALKLTGQSG